MNELSARNLTQTGSRGDYASSICSGRTPRADRWTAQALLKVIVVPLWKSLFRFGM